MLLGVRQAVPELFSGVSWGTDAVLTATRRAMLALGWDWEELPVRWDVDRPADLQRLAALAIEIPGGKRANPRLHQGRAKRGLDTR